jgi:transposase
MNITTIGLDIAKQVFHVVGTDARGDLVLKKRLRRCKVLEYFANLPVCVVGIEACGGSQYWAGELKALGHDARLMNPKYVKPFLRGNKNDYNDAGALSEAVVHPRMRFVPLKTPEQLDLQALHRIRDGLVKDRTVLVNRIRGLLGERGIVMPKGIGAFRRRLPEVLEDGDNGLSDLFRGLVAQTWEQIRDLDKRIACHKASLEQASASHQVCQRLEEMPGVGPIIATALVAGAGDAGSFHNGRHFSAWMGLVPRQHSTGGKPRLLGISKRGDKRLRALMIHGARSVIRHAGHKTDPLSRWIQALQARKGTNVTAVALANKMTRIAWVIMSRGERYQPALATRY